MLGMIAVAPCACSASTGAEPAVISQSPQLQRWQHFVSEASARFHIPQAWICAVIDAESRPHAVRGAGADVHRLLPADHPRRTVVFLRQRR